jgi:hypothetical protein
VLDLSREIIYRRGITYVGSNCEKCRQVPTEQTKEDLKTLIFALGHSIIGENQGQGCLSFKLIINDRTERERERAGEGEKF